MRRASLVSPQAASTTLWQSRPDAPGFFRATGRPPVPDGAPGLPLARGLRASRDRAYVPPLLLVPSRGEAQLTFLDGMGYASVGMVAGSAVGLLLTSITHPTCDDFICLPAEAVVPLLVGTVAGGVVGQRIGRGAEEDARRGERARHLGAASIGAVLGGAVTGMAVGGFLVNESNANGDGSGTFLGNDELSIAIMSAIGTGLSVLYLHSRWDDLTGRGPRLRPALVGRHFGVVTRIRF